MKIANRILNILVLLAALGAAVCAFFLFQKREQITKGRQMMSEAVVKTVKTIDPSVKISADDMSIAKPAADLAAPLKILDDNTRKIVDQRNKIAESVAVISNSVMGWSGDKAKKGEEFADYQIVQVTESPDGKTTLSKLDENTQIVSARAKYYIDRNDKVKDGITRLSGALATSNIPESSFSPDGDNNNRVLAAQFDKLFNRAKMFVSRYSAFNKHLTSTAQILGYQNDVKKASLNQNVTEPFFTKNLTAHMQQIRGVAKKIRDQQDKIAAQQRTINSQAAQIKSLNSTIAARNATIAKFTKDMAAAQKEIERLKGIIDPDWRSSVGTKRSSSEEFKHLRRLKGKVLSVNSKLGFVVINLGKKNKYKDIKTDVNTGKEVPTVRSIDIPQDAIMTVATSLEPDKADYVCRLVAVRVGDDSTVANIIVTGGGRVPKVGDVVFFSESDVRQMKAGRDAAKNVKNVNVAPSSSSSSSSAASAGKKSEEDELESLLK